MNGFNRVFLAGYLGAQPTLKQSSGGKPFCHLSLATQRPYKGTDGQWESETHWHSITVWGKKAELCTNYLNKGSGLAVEGSLHHFRGSEPDSPKKTTVVADQVHFLDRRRANKDSSEEDSS